MTTSERMVAHDLLTAAIDRVQRQTLTDTRRVVSKYRQDNLITWGQFNVFTDRLDQKAKAFGLTWDKHNRCYSAPEPRDEHGRTGADRLFVCLDLTRRFGLSTVQATALIEGRTVGGKTIEDYIN